MGSFVIRHSWICQTKPLTSSRIVDRIVFGSRTQHQPLIYIPAICKRNLTTAYITFTYSDTVVEDDQAVTDKFQTRAQSDASQTVADEKTDSPVLDHSIGIKTAISTQPFERWLHESDVTAQDTQKQRLVDSPAHRLDFKLWVRLLELRSRIEGHSGSWSIYMGLKQRKIDLPTDGLYAQKLWDPIISAALALGLYEELWEDILDQYNRTGQHYTELYSKVVAHHLPVSRRHTIREHDRLHQLGLPVDGNLRAAIGPLSLSKNGSRTLMEIYELGPERGLYDKLITTLITLKDWKGAWNWHFRLLQNQDFPSSLQILEPLTRRLSLNGQFDMRDRLHQSLAQCSLAADVNDRSIKTPLVLPMSANSFVYSASSALTDGKEDASDRFCARAFATRAFTPGLVIRALSTFGVRLIGSLSLRELTARCHFLVQSFKADEDNFHDILAREICVQLDHLHAANILIKDCAFTRFVRKLARNGQGKMLESVIFCDQHPDVFEDSQTQLNLLRSYIRNEDWSQIQRTLALLTISSAEAATTGCNYFLQALMDSGHPGYQGQIDKTLNIMRQSGIRVSTSTLRRSYFHLISEKSSSTTSKMRAEKLNKLGFLTRMWMEAVQGGLHIPAGCWNQVMKQYGQTGLYDQLESLCFELARRYSPQIRSSATRFERRSKSQLRLLFPPSRQRAIVEWYMKSLQHSSLFRHQSDETIRNAPASDMTSSANLWVRGLAILQRLRKYGVQIDTHALCSSIRHRLMVLYGPGMSKRLHNRMAARTNPYSLRAMIRHMELVWSPTGSLFDLPKALLVPRDNEIEEKRVETLMRRFILCEPVSMRDSKDRDRDSKEEIRGRYRQLYASERKFPPNEAVEHALVNGGGLLADNHYDCDLVDADRDAVVETDRNAVMGVDRTVGAVKSDK